jgi:LPS export ABC transporter protein LptC
MKTNLLITLLITASLLASCSFNYGEQDNETSVLPDISMTNMNYVRVENGRPTVRFYAESADRYEKSRTMELFNYGFEQYNRETGEADAKGTGGKAKIEMETRDVIMEESVSVQVKSEDMAIDTKTLRWSNSQKELSSPEDSPVHIKDPDGTDFTGSGFSANTKKRTWEFTAGVSGTYVQDDDDVGVPPQAAGVPPVAVEPEEYVTAEAAPLSPRLTMPQAADAPPAGVPPVAVEAAAPQAVEPGVKEVMVMPTPLASEEAGVPPAGVPPVAQEEAGVQP